MAHPVGMYTNAELCPVVCYRLRGSPSEIPEKNLWFAVLYRAMCDAVHGRDYEFVMTYPVKDDALKWFKSKSTEEGSFNWICLMLDFNAGHIQTIMEQINSDTFARITYRVD